MAANSPRLTGGKPRAGRAPSGMGTGRSRFWDNARDILLIVGRDGRILDANPTAVASYGYDRKELLSLRIHDLRDPETVPEVELQLERAEREGILFETVHRRKDGSSFPVEVNSRGVVIGRKKALLSVIRDISVRRNVEESLRTRTELLEAIVGVSPLAIVTFDAEGRIGMWNSAAERMFGWTAGEAVGTFHPIVAGEKREEFRRLRQRALSGEVFVGMELRRKRKDGSDIDISVSTSPIRDADGTITAIMSIITDITDRKRAQEATIRNIWQHETLSLASQRVNAVLEIPVILRTLVTSAIELVEAGAGAAGLLRDGKMVFTEYNDRGTLVPIDFVFEPGNGVPGHVMATREPYISNDAASDPYVIPEIREALGFYNLIDVPIVDRRGELLGCFEIYNTVDRRPFDEQDVVMLKGLAAGAAVALENARMLEERKKTEVELRLLATAIEQSDETVVITDPGGIIRYVNPAFEKITGYRREEAVGQNPRLLKSGVQDTPFYRQMWDTILRGEVWTGVFVNRKKDGSLYEEEAILSPVRDVSGTIVNFVAVKRDVTEARRMEEELRHAQKMEAVGRLAGGVAHDFNNLLTAITGYSEMLLARLGEEDPSRREIAEIRKAGERAASLTRQLLAFSSKQVLRPKVMDLNSVVSDMKKMLHRLIGEDIELSTVFGSDTAFVRADPGQIEQVLVNLVVNSRDAMPEGGKLIVETASVDLDEGYVSRHDPMPPGEYVMMAVTDTGCGMDENTVARIFEPFFTTKEKGRGTGLGLSTVYGIVKQSGGFVWAYSEPGRGTTFRVYLPRVSRSVEPVEETEVHPPIAAGAETVLVTEDEEMVRDLVCTILRRNGYNILEARDGEEALREAKRHEGPIHLLVTDVVMPRIGGPELAERLSALRPGIRVLFISGYTGTAVTQLGMLPSGSAFLEKPFVPGTLVSRVRGLLDAS